LTLSQSEIIPGSSDYPWYNPKENIFYNWDTIQTKTKIKKTRRITTLLIYYFIVIPILVLLIMFEEYYSEVSRIPW